MHPNKIGFKNLDSSGFKKLRDGEAKQTTIRSLFRQTDRRLEYGLIASYNISKLLAETAMPHTFEDFVLTPVEEMIETVL